MDEERGKKLSAVVKYGLMLAVCFAVAPFIFGAIQGLVGLLVAGAISYTAIELTPWFSRKVANGVMKLLRHEARTNPIETRMNILIDMREKLKQYANEITTFAAEVRNFADEVKALQQTQPEDAADFEEQLRNLHLLLERKKQAYERATAQANEFEVATQRAARKWKVAQSAIRMNKLAGQSKDDMLNKIMAEEALDSVQTAMNRAFAELDTAVAEHGPAKYDKSNPFAERVQVGASTDAKGATR